MSRVTNISGGPLDIPMLGRVVEDGETIDVPDFQPAHNPDSAPGDPDYLAITWPDDKWEPAGGPATGEGDGGDGGGDDEDGKADT